MIILQALWSKATLHIWAEEPHRHGAATSGASEARNDSTIGATAEPLAIQPLRGILGDLCDSLLVSGADASRVRLLLPHGQGKMLSSQVSHKLSESELQRIDVDTLAFTPADAVDLLTSFPPCFEIGVICGASFRYWGRAAQLVLELLARQRFVPAVQGVGEDQYRGVWRVVIRDRETTKRLRALVSSMPPVCRSEVRHPHPQTADLVDDFVAATVDGLVRRCLDRDELVHALDERAAGSGAALIRWLCSLVRPDGRLSGTSEEQQFVFETAQRWLAELEPASQKRTCRTCFTLQAPEEGGDGSDGDSAAPWRLSFQIQELGDPSLTVEATDLAEHAPADSRALHGPFENPLKQLRADLAHAARHFPPLAPCAEPSGPLQRELTLSEAHRFLKDTAPILEAEGFLVSAPLWWHERRPRLRMQMELRPLSSSEKGEAQPIRLDSMVAYDWRVALGDEHLSTEEISQLAATKEPLVRLRGRWTELEADDLKRALAFLRRKRPTAISLMEALRASYVDDDLDTGLPVAPLRARGWIRAMLDATTAEGPIEAVAVPKGFHGSLRGYQLKGLQWLCFMARHGLGACLADDMGLGKTIQLIALLLWEREQPQPPGPTLLIVPMSLVGNWKRELTRFSPTLRVMVHHGLDRLAGREFQRQAREYDVVISTYGLVPRDLEHFMEIAWHRVALDEAQKIKNPAAKQHRAIRMLQAHHRVALTGTPVENRLSELWSIMNFLNRGYLSSVQEFRRKFAVPIERYHDGPRSERLRNLIRPFVLRRRKDDPGILDDLPEKLEMSVYCNLTREQAALYEAVVNDMLAQIDTSGGIQRRGLILATLVKLKQICNHPTQFLRDDGGLAHRSGKCDRVTEMLEEVIAEGHRALVFTQFREMGHLLQRHLRQALGTEVLFLHGGTPQKARTAMVEAFQSGDDGRPVFLLSLKAGGFGLNLTAANHVFLFDRWWNPAVEDQAADRAHRIGQSKQVQVHKFVCVGTLEERITDLIERKRALAENIVGGGEGWLTELTTDALRDMFVLSQEAVVED